jgi:hypothetical protein
MLVAFSGTFTLDPVEEVSVIVFISTMKERRFVLGGGVSGVARAVKLSVAVPPPGGGVFFDPPLQEIRETTDSNTSEAKTFRKFTRPPRQSLCRAKGEQRHTHVPHAILSLTSKVMDVKGM